MENKKERTFIRISIPTGIALIITLIIFITVLQILSSHVLLAADYGQWIGFARFYLGRTFPSYIPPLVNPPVYFLYLAGLILTVGNEVLASSIATALTYSLLSLSTYFLAKELFNDQITALLALFLTAFTQPFFFEALSFGAVTQLFSMIWITLAALFMHRIYIDNQERNWIMLSIVTGLTLFTHTPTALFYSLTAFSWFLIILYLRRDQILALFKFAIKYLSLPFILWIYYLTSLRHVFVGYFNEAAYYRKSISSFLFLQDDTITLILLTVIAASLTCLLLFSVIKRKGTVSFSMLASWLLIPLLLMLTLHMTYVGVDYGRIRVFIAQPLMLVLAYKAKPLVLIKDIKRTAFKKNRSRLFAFVTVLLILFGTAVFDLQYFAVAVEWYTIEKDENVEVINWIKDNALLNDTIVTDSVRFGKWIQGLTGRPTLNPILPRYSNRPYEAERIISADVITTSRFGVENGLIYVKASPVFPYNPSLAVYYKGEYEDTVWLCDENTTVSVATTSSGNVTSTISNFTDSQNFSFIADEQSVSITSFHEGSILNSAINLTKDISVKQGSATCSINLTFVSDENTTIKDVTLNFQGPLEDPPTQIQVYDNHFIWIQKKFDDYLLHTKVQFDPEPTNINTTITNDYLNHSFAAVTFNFNDQEATIHIEVQMDPWPLHSDHPLKIYDSLVLIQEYNVEFFVVQKDDTRALTLVSSEYKGDIVFENEEYSVYRVGV